MGWQDREWAKLRDDELDALYGFRKPPSSRPRFSARTIVWSCIAALVVAVGGFAYTQMPRDRIADSSALPPAVVYGQLGTFAGDPGACIELELVGAGRWRCDTFQLKIGLMLRYTRFAEATPYDGPCAHLKADQASGRWVCVSVTPAASNGVNS